MQARDLGRIAKAKPLPAQHSGAWPAHQGMSAPHDPVAELISLGARNGSVRAHASLLDRAGSGQPHHHSTSALLQLQGQYGNRYVQRVLALTRQADGAGEVTPEVEEAIQRHRSGGQALDSGVRGSMESAFVVDFSGVRVHTGAESDALNRALSARAFTTGRDIFFRNGEYSPGSSSGRELLAHELTHVVQQRGSVQTKLVVGEPGDIHEQEAYQLAPILAARAHENAMKQSQELTANSRDLDETIGLSATNLESATIQSRGTQSIAGRQSLEIARASSPESPKGSNFTSEQWQLLEQASAKLQPKKGSIVGVLIADDGRKFEIESGGGQGFSSHIEGKATAKMNELGITKAVLLSPLEPCQLCDRSDYPAAVGPVAPMKSTATGKELSRQTPKINSALPIGSELHVIGPHSTGIYRGTKSVRSTGAALGGAGESTEKPPAAEVTSSGEAGEDVKKGASAPKAAPAIPKEPTAPVRAGTAKAAVPSSPSSKVPEAAPEAPTAGRPKVNVEVEAGRVRVNVEGGWKWAGRVVTGATMGLQVYGVIQTIDGAISQIEKAETGSVRPEVAKAMATVDAAFPSASSIWKEKFRSWNEDVNYPGARDWLFNNGVQALVQKGKMLETMGDHLNTVFWYNRYLDDLEYDYGNYQNQLSLIHEDIKWRRRALYDISEDILKLIPGFPSDIAQLQLWGFYETFHDAAQDMSRLESQISVRTSEYKQWKDKAHAGRIEAARWLNWWAAGYQKVSGKKLLITHVPE